MMGLVILARRGIAKVLMRGAVLNDGAADRSKKCLQDIGCVRLVESVCSLVFSGPAARSGYFDKALSRSFGIR